MKTIILIFLVSASTVVSQLLLKKGAIDFKLNRIDVSLVLSAISSPYILSSICLQLFSFVLWFVVLSKANLGYAIGFSGAFLYLMLPLLSWLIYDEKLGAIQWLGLILITAGILCMANKS
jgi:drug/metabolite transporter (DMT)-like permease